MDYSIGLMALTGFSMGPKSLTLLVALACLTCLLTSPVQARTDIWVGDDNGWKNNNFNYTTWAASKAFTFGDTLVFTYTAGAHNVQMVGGEDFKNCATSSSLGSYYSGGDRVPLNMTGNMWFLCSIGDHCVNGMKFKITVVGGAVASTPVQAPGAAPPTSGGAPLMDSAASAFMFIMFACIANFLG